MSDLRTLLHDSAIPSTDTSDAVADAQVAHARGVLRRRNAKRVSVGSTFVAAAALAAFAIGGQNIAPASPEADPSNNRTTTNTEAPGVRLVSYTGTQPTGYTLDKVPVGWVIDHNDLSLLTLAPADATPDQESPGTVSLEGKIAIMTQTIGVPDGVPLDDVKVGGQSAVIAHMLGSGDTRTLFVEQPSGTYLEIQVWTGLGWDNNEIAAFADSVHVNTGAQTSVG